MQYDGTALWQGIVDVSMERRAYNGLQYDTYAGLADNLYEALCTSAGKAPSKTCLVDDDGTCVTFAEFLEMVEEMARPATPKGSVSSIQPTMLARMEIPPAIRGVRPFCWAK